jgi:hypothetical protein
MWPENYFRKYFWKNFCENVFGKFLCGPSGSLKNIFGKIFFWKIFSATRNLFGGRPEIFKKLRGIFEKI